MITNNNFNNFGWTEEEQETTEPYDCFCKELLHQVVDHYEEQIQKRNDIILSLLTEDSEIQDEHIEIVSDLLQPIIQEVENDLELEELLDEIQKRGQ